MLIFLLMFVDVVNELQELCVLLELYGFWLRKLGKTGGFTEYFIDVEYMFFDGDA